MSRPPPRLRLHRQSGRAVVTFSDAKTKARRDVMLGDYGGAEAAARYYLLMACWERHGRRLAPVIELARDLNLTGAAAAPLAVTENSPTVRVLRSRRPAAEVDRTEGRPHQSRTVEVKRHGDIDDLLNEARRLAGVAHRAGKAEGAIEARREAARPTEN